MFEKAMLGPGIKCIALGTQTSRRGDGVGIPGKGKAFENRSTWGLGI